MPAHEQLGSKRAEVLDDTVMDDRYSAGAIEMGMGVRLGDAAMRGPSGVPETEAGHREISSS